MNNPIVTIANTTSPGTHETTPVRLSLTAATIRDPDDARIEKEMQQHLQECGVSADVKVTPVAGHPCRRRCAISSSADIEQIFGAVAAFFESDRLTPWMPAETQDDECCAFDFALPSASIEDKQALQSELEAMMIGDEEDEGDEGERFIQPEPSTGGDQVYAPLRYEFYDAIEFGEKTVEYREYTDNWAKKLLSRPMKTIKFSRGYGHAGAKPRQMVFAITNIGIVDANSEKEIPARHEDGSLVGEADVEPSFTPTHFAIHLGDRLS